MVNINKKIIERLKNLKKHAKNVFFLVTFFLFLLQKIEKKFVKTNKNTLK